MNPEWRLADQLVKQQVQCKSAFVAQPLCALGKSDLISVELQGDSDFWGFDHAFVFQVTRCCLNG